MTYWPDVSLKLAKFQTKDRLHEGLNGFLNLDALVDAIQKLSSDRELRLELWIGPAHPSPVRHGEAEGLDELHDSSSPVVEGAVTPADATVVEGAAGSPLSPGGLPQGGAS